MAKNILIVDDSMFMRSAVKKILKQTSLTYEEANNGEKALEMIQDGQYDLITLDLLMPIMTGFQVLEKLKEINSNIPVIVLTADIQASAKQQCLDLGAIKVLKKPPNMGEVLSTIKEILGTLI